MVVQSEKNIFNENQKHENFIQKKESQLNIQNRNNNQLNLFQTVQYESYSNN